MKTNLRLAATGLMAVAALLVTACGSNSSSGASPSSGGSSTPAAASGPGIKTATTSIGTVLTDSAGKTVYWFAPDTSSKSNCNGACATFWPPVKGPVSAASGVSLAGTFGTITRSDGTTQATYDGHPLYTYAADSGPGATSGNGLNLSGGVWHAMTPTAAIPGKAAPTPAASTSSSGGYGY